MISLQRSMHSSQMYTPGPAMSFLTCFWLFPQNEHFSKSPPSPMRATQLLPCLGPPRQPRDHHQRTPPPSVHPVLDPTLPPCRPWARLHPPGPLGSAAASRP